MLERLDMAVGRWLADRVRQVAAHAGAVLGVAGALTLLLAVYTLQGIGLDMDHKRVLSPDIPFQKAARAFEKYFPSLDDALLVVIDGETPELARAAATRLAERLRVDEANFTDVYVPGSGSFFLEHGLLYRTTEELEDFVDQLAAFQPIIADLDRDNSIANLARLLERAMERDAAERGDETDWPTLLDQVGQATVEVFRDYPVSISWESLMLAGSAVDVTHRQVIIAAPVLDFDALLPAAGPIEAVETMAQELGLVPDRGVTVRLTGNPALNHDEMLGLIWDVGVAGVLSFVLVTVLLGVALRSVRGALAAAATLVIGLVWTAAFATAAVGKLNILSVSFSVLFIGLGVDFAIHLAMHVFAERRAGQSLTDALASASRTYGSALVLCSITTAIGFLSFVPTPYRGVAQLGLIAGGGMVVIIVLTFTVFPALLLVILGDTPLRAGAEAGRYRAPLVASTHPRTVALVFAAVVLLALWAVPASRFDANVVVMRNQSTSSVEAFRDLLSDTRNSPWSIDVLAPDLDAAAASAERLRRLPEVQQVLTLRDYVPADQQDKREILENGAFLLDAPPAATVELPPMDAGAQVAALAQLADVLGTEAFEAGTGPLAISMRRLREKLGRYLALIAQVDDPTPALDELQEVLLGNFPGQVRRLKQALRPSEVTLDSLPHELHTRMLAPDGHARIQVFPHADLSDTPALIAFVDAVRLLEPDGTGVAVNILEFGRATVASLQQALVVAMLAIAVLLVVLLRRGMDTVMALAPLIVAAVLTGGAMVLFDIPFNFVNIVVLPLLLGIGVDSGIHLVRTSQQSHVGVHELLHSTTARAVFFSAVTTLVSFGTLAFSPHQGVSSLGVVLVIGMLLTLACNLILLPALLMLRART